jgi:hypothetical protein
MAPQVVSQFTEVVGDSQQLSTGIPGNWFRQRTMPSHFLSITTRNGSGRKSAMKRETVPMKFLSRFTPIDLPEIGAEAAATIAVGVFSEVGYRNDRSIAICLPLFIARRVSW